MSTSAAFQASGTHEYWPAMAQSFSRPQALSWTHPFFLWLSIKLISSTDNRADLPQACWVGVGWPWCQGHRKKSATGPLECGLSVSRVWSGHTSFQFQLQIGDFSRLLFIADKEQNFHFGPLMFPLTLPNRVELQYPTYLGSKLPLT